MLENAVAFMRRWTNPVHLQHVGEVSPVTLVVVSAGALQLVSKPRQGPQGAGSCQKHAETWLLGGMPAN